MPITFTEKDFEDEVPFSESDFMDEETERAPAPFAPVPQDIIQAAPGRTAPRMPIRPQGILQPPVGTTEPIVPLPEPKPSWLNYYFIPGLGAGGYSLLPEAVKKHTDPYARAALGEAKSLVEFAESPLGITTARLGALGPLSRRIITALFGADIARNVPEVARQAGEASVTGTPEQRAQAYTRLGTTMALPAILGKETLHPTAIPARKAAAVVPETPAEAPTVPVEPVAPAPVAEPKPAAPVEPAAPVSRAVQWYGPDGAIEDIVDVNPAKKKALVRYRGADPNAPPVEIDSQKMFAQPVRAKLKQAEMELTPEEESYQKQERAAIDTAAAANKEAGLPSEVEVVDSLPEGDPFAKNFGESIATIRKGKILVNRDNFRNWISTIPEKFRQRAINSLMNEEGIHSKVQDVLGDQEMGKMWESLSPVERAMMRRSYTDQWAEIIDPKDPRYVSPSDMGHEYMRRVMQWATKADVREVIGARGQGMEWLKQKGIDLGLRAIDTILKEGDRKLSEVMISRLHNARQNLEALSVARGSPRALTKEDLDPNLPEHIKARILARRSQLPGMMQVKGAPSEAIQAAMAKFGVKPEQVKAAEVAPVSSPEQAAQILDSGIKGTRQAFEVGFQAFKNPELAERVRSMREQAAKDFESQKTVQNQFKKQMLDEALEIVDQRWDKPMTARFMQEKGMTPAEGGPAAMRRKPTPEERGIQPTFAFGKPGEAPERPTAEQAGAFIEPPSIEKATSLASEYLADPVAFMKKKLTKGGKLVTPKKSEVVTPKFSDFEKEMKRRYGGQAYPETIRAAWEESVWKSLMGMEGKEMERLRDRLGLKETLGEKEISSPEEAAVEAEVAVEEPVPVTQEAWLAGKLREKEKAAEAKKMKAQAEYQKTLDTPEGRRLHAISLIGEKLIEQSRPETRSDPERPKLFTADIAFNLEKKGIEPAWVEFDPSKPQKNLGLRLTSGSRVKDQPESMTRRVTAVRDNMTGEVHMLSTFRTGEGSIQIFDPTVPSTSRRPHVPFASLMSRKFGSRPNYTVLGSAMVKDPVQNFHQRFRSELEWREQFADPALSQAGSLKEAPEVSEETPLEPERPALKTGAPLTDAEAGAIFRQFSEEVGGKVESLEDTRQLFEALILNPKIGERPTAQQIQVANALDKAWRKILGEKLDPITKKPLLTPEEAMTRLFDWIYENTRQGKTREGFTAEALRRFAPPREPVAPEGAAPATKIRTAEDVARQIAEQRARYAGTRMPFDQWLQERGPFSPSLYTQEGRTVPEPAFAPGRMGTRLPPQEPRPVAVPEQLTEALRSKAAAEPQGEIARGPAALRPRDIKRSVSTLLNDTLVGVLRGYSEWMVDGIRRQGGWRTRQAANIFNEMIDREKELRGSFEQPVSQQGFSPGEARQILDAAKRLGFKKADSAGLLDMARKAAGKPGKATAWLHRLENVTDKAAISNAVGMMERTRPVPAYVNDLAILTRSANLVIGRMYESFITGFQASAKFQRNLTAFGYDIIRQGEGKVWDAWTNGLAVANGMTPWNVQQFFRNWKRILDDPAPDSNALEKVNQDFAREFPNAITHVKVGDVAPMWQQVVHSDLFNYLETAARRASHIKAFRERFPNDINGRRQLAITDRSVREELGPDGQENYNALIRTLQGHPTDSYNRLGILAPGRTIPEVFRFVNQTLGNLFARGVLTGQMLVQPGENIAGSTPVFLGYKNYLRGAARVYQIYPEMEIRGSVNRVIYDWSFDPVNPIRSSFRIASNVLSKGFMEQFLNELQEATAAATARMVSERIQAGTLSNWEKRMLPETFRAMGFEPSQVADMMRGNRPLLDQFERKAAAFLSSGNKAISEGSRLGANRLLNSIFRFQAYPMMKTNQLRKVTGRLFEAWGRGTAAEKRASTEQFARFMFGNALQGALTVGIATMFYEGWFGTNIRKEEAKDEPFKFFTESLLSSMSGPLYMVWRGARNKGMKGITEQATRMVFPYSVLRDIYDAAHGAGQYKDLGTFDRIGKFVNQKMPGTRAISMGLSIFGLSQDDKKLETSIRAFYRWRRDALGFKEQEDFLNDDTRAEFRKAMKKAVEAMKSGDVDAYTDSIAEASGQARKPKQDVAASLRARKLLKTPDGKPLNPDQMDALEKHIGSAAVDRLRYFDLMLESAAEGSVLPRYD